MGFGKVSGTAVNLQGPNQMEGRMACLPASPSRSPAPSPCRDPSAFAQTHQQLSLPSGPADLKVIEVTVNEWVDFLQPQLSMQAEILTKKEKCAGGPHELRSGPAWTSKGAVASTAATCPNVCVHGLRTQRAVQTPCISGADHP